MSLKKIGLELVVRVDGHKRTIMLPPALSGYRPGAASFDNGTLEVKFEPQPGPVPRATVRSASGSGSE